MTTRNGKQKIKLRAIQRRRSDIDFEDPKVYKACLGKRVYRTKRIARDEAKRLMKQYGTPYKGYHCRYYDHWHLTTRILTVEVEPEPEVEIAHPSAPERLLQSLVDTKIKRLMRRA